MNFTKMHGCGNDYIFLASYDNDLWPDDLSHFAREISDRRLGVGADGLIVVEPSPQADARMRIWNADGSEAEMCGNGIRCAARLIYERGWHRRSNTTNEIASRSLQIETARGLLAVELKLDQGEFVSARVNMGPPIFEPSAIPFVSKLPRVFNTILNAKETKYRVSAVSMGNPHCVLILEDQEGNPSHPLPAESLHDFPVATVGGLLEHHASFPRRTNVEFVRLVARDELEVRVWERGAGETMACGTGACAAVVVACTLGHCERTARVRMPGGMLWVEWTDTGDVYLEGPAVEVCTGSWSNRSARFRLGEVQRPFGAPYWKTRSA